MDLKYFSSRKLSASNENTRYCLLERRPSQSNSGSSISTSMSVSLSEKTVLPPFPVYCNINETDRLISDQGLITPKERSNVSRRRIRDKSYYKGLIYLKGKEVNDEIKKLQKEVSLLHIEQSIYLPYKKKAELKAIGLQNLQKMLANYNILDDMLNRDMQLNEANEQLENLEETNKNESAELDNLFNLTKQQEIIIKEMEADLSQENYIAEILAITMNPQLCEKYKKLKRIDDKLQLDRIKQEEDLRSLIREKKNLENHCCRSKDLKEGLKLLRILWPIENQREELDSEKIFSSISEEHEYLQKHKTSCIELLNGMVQESRNLENKIKDVMEELKIIENETLHLFTDRSLKYAKLKKKENIIDEFLSSHCDQQFIILEKHQQLECNVKELLTEISNKLGFLNSNLPNDTGINSMNDEDAKLKLDYLKTTIEWEKMNNIELKLYEEKDLLEEEIVAKGKKLSILSNIENSEEGLKIKGKNLSNELKQLKCQKRSWTIILNDLKKRYELLQGKLQNDQTYIMLSTLEKRWQSLEEENFSLENFVASNASGKKYLLVKNEVRKIYSELNKML